MRLIVQKFGGTSVKSKEDRQHVIKQIHRALTDYDKVVVVVSAMGRYPDPYATDTLLQLVDQPETNHAKREVDLLISCGEIISATVLANEIRRQKIRTVALTGAQAGLITDNQYSAAVIKNVKTERILKELAMNDVVVIAGFQGMSEDSEITTLGRGGSDTSASIFAAALQAELIEIFTDVNGMMTADPHVVQNARALKVVTYTEISHLAYQGAKIVHPRAVEIAMEANIPMRIRSTFSDDVGTLVTHRLSNRLDERIKKHARLVTGIAYVDGIYQLKIKINESDLRAQATIFQLMAKENISVDFINISATEIAFTVPRDVVSKSVSLIERAGYEVKLKENCAKVSVVGAGMTGIPGVAAKITQALVNAGIQVLQSADSHTTIWVLIENSHLNNAVNALHEAFELGK